MMLEWQAMSALIKGEVDIAGKPEVPFISQVFKKQNVSIYAGLDKLQFVYLIGRKDRGIQSAGDLKGKRIGLPRGTIAEFYFGRYLELSGLSMGDVTIFNTTPDALVEGISNGILDGVVIWNPYAYQLSRQMGDGVILLRVQSRQPAFALAVGRSDWLAANRGLISRSLKAIAEAEDYLASHPAEAKAIVRERMNYDEAFMESVWSENQFSLSLDQPLILAMEDEARWMTSNSLTTGTTVPNFLDYIYVDALKAVKPEAVKIIK
jgi:NitT/TauT family transport system substrate-binding protein